MIAPSRSGTQRRESVPVSLMGMLLVSVLWPGMTISLLLFLVCYVSFDLLVLILSSGSRDHTIINHDVRVADHAINTLRAHTQEVCGLRWSPDGQQLASGGNDNVVNIWDLTRQDPLHSLTQHTSAVKALAWCPFQANTLATGGGTGDKTIRTWNTETGACLNVVDTKSQVCQLMWSTNYRELISSHGFSQNQLTVWKYPSMTKIAELTGILLVLYSVCTLGLHYRRAHWKSPSPCYEP